VDSLLSGFSSKAGAKGFLHPIIKRKTGRIILK